MALEIDRPTDPDGASRPRREPAHTLTVGLVNNMPDSALEATEAQFGSLLAEASAGRSVRLLFTSIPEVPRSPSSREHIHRNYWPLKTVLQDAPDALIVTGTEPVAQSLRDEPYWGSFTELLRWAEANTLSSVWSCLAAHGAVLELDGIERQRLPQKRFGVFEHATRPGEPLLAGISANLPMPHSRWNDLPVAALRDAGYRILSEGTTTGADLFVREARSLFVFFQGHPEYEATTLLKEYRRDVGRYLCGQHQHFPPPPANYFTPTGSQKYRDFERQALQRRNPEALKTFPDATATDLQSTWRVDAVRMYHNWLSHVTTLKDSAQGGLR